MKKNLKPGNKVYHVANPDVSGIIIPEDPNKNIRGLDFINVVFLSPVTFSGNPNRIDKHWICNKQLLHSSSWAAKMNQKENYD